MLLVAHVERCVVCKARTGRYAWCEEQEEGESGQFSFILPDAVTNAQTLSAVSPARLSAAPAWVVQANKRHHRRRPGM